MSKARKLHVDTATVSGGRSAKRNLMPGLLRNRSEGVLRFEYGFHTIGFGLDLDPAEARRAAEIIIRKFPSLSP